MKAGIPKETGHGDMQYISQPYVLTSHQPLRVSLVSSLLQYTSLCYMTAPELSREPAGGPRHVNELEDRVSIADNSGGPPQEVSCIDKALGIGVSSRVAEVLLQRQRPYMFREALGHSYPAAPAPAESCDPEPVVQTKEAVVAPCTSRVVDYTAAAKKKLNQMRKDCARAKASAAKCTALTGKKTCRSAFVYAWKCCGGSTRTCSKHTPSCMVCGQKMCPVCNGGTKTCNKCDTA